MQMFNGTPGNDVWIGAIDLPNFGYGDPGNDRLVGGNLVDSFAGDLGDDTLIGRGGDDLLYGGEGNDSLEGGTGNDVVSGGSGNDRLDGGVGADLLAGGNGNDIYIVDNIGDVVVELPAAGLDTVQSSITYALTTNVENLVLTGAAAINGTGNELNNVLTGNQGNNILRGGAGHDSLNSNAGNDILLGDVGNDQLIGGTGRDVLTGGAGNDRFRYLSVSDSLPGLATRDVITDFSGNGILAGDQIDLSAIDANPLLAGVQRFNYIGFAAFSAPGQVRYSGGIIQINTIGNGGAESEIQLNGAPALWVSANPAITDIIL